MLIKSIPLGNSNSKKIQLILGCWKDARRRKNTHHRCQSHHREARQKGFWIPSRIISQYLLKTTEARKTDCQLVWKCKNSISGFRLLVGDSSNNAHQTGTHGDRLDQLPKVPYLFVEDMSEGIIFVKFFAREGCSANCGQIPKKEPFSNDFECIW